jgi:hypothetical protein
MNMWGRRTSHPQASITQDFIELFEPFFFEHAFCPRPIGRSTERKGE